MVILNSSSDLTFRDHKKASLFCSSLDIQITRMSAAQSQLPDKPLIVFADENEFLVLLSKGQLSFAKNRCLIIDEFDSVFFEGGSREQKLDVLAKSFNDIIGFSGSEL